MQRLAIHFNGQYETLASVVYRRSDWIGFEEGVHFLKLIKLLTYTNKADTLNKVKYGGLGLQVENNLLQLDINLEHF